VSGDKLALAVVAALAATGLVRRRGDLNANRTFAGELAVRYAHPYVSPRQRRLTASQAQVRRTAYTLKSDDAIGAHVAEDLARLISDISDPVLVPIPDSRGATTKNLALAVAVARLHPGAVVCDVLTRADPVPSSLLQRRLGRSSLSVSRHRMVALSDCPGPVFFVDNVATTGNTLRAAKAALGGRGEGLVWAAHLGVLT
jgi:hypothetical protein